MGATWCVCFFLCLLCCPVVVQWTAPEVRAGSEATGRVATVESDVYMVGGLAYELLTGGTTPFHWLLGHPQLLAQRLLTADPVEVPDCLTVPGLLHVNVLEALSIGKRPVPWCVQADGTPGSAGRLEELKGVVAQCLAKEPGDRPKLPALLATLEDLQGKEAGDGDGGGSGGAAAGGAAVAGAGGVGDGGGASTPRSGGSVSSVLPVHPTPSSSLAGE